MRYIHTIHIFLTKVNLPTKRNFAASICYQLYFQDNFQSVSEKLFKTVQWVSLCRVHLTLLSYFCFPVGFSLPVLAFVLHLILYCRPDDRYFKA